MAQLAESNDAEDTEGTLGDQLNEYFSDHGRRRVLLVQLRERFGELPASAVARVKAAGGAELDVWAVRVLRAATLDEVLAG